MATTKTYDVCVIGAGMIGSAAARHASSIENVNICIIGPDEPKSRTLEDGREIFGAHYDEGRVTRNSDPDHVWELFAQESIKRYRKLEEMSGISFYNEVGYIIAGEKDGKFIKETKQMVKDLNTIYYSPTELREKFPYFNFNPNDEGVYEPNNSGHICPRNMIKAQLKVAQMNGCDVIEDVVSSVIQRKDENGENIMEIKTESGQMYFSRKVLVATGAFTEFRNLLNKSPDVQLMGANIAKVEISEKDAEILKDMPSVYYYGKGQEHWSKECHRNQENVFEFYMLPPIKYPDNKFYIKMGVTLEVQRKQLSTMEDVRKWYCYDGDPVINKSVAQMIINVVKDISMLSYHGDCCVICTTPTKRPYIDMVHSQLGVAIGGNGWAAKSGDEIGRIAAMMVVQDKWESPLPQEYFKIRFKTEIVQNKA